MTTQPETAQSAPVIERVSRIEGIVEQINLRLAENHDGIQALSDKIDTKVDALNDKIETQGRELRAEIHALNEKIDAKTDAIHDKIDRLRSEMHRQTLLLAGILGGLMTLLRFVG